MDELDKIKARYLAVLPKIATVDLRRNPTLLAEIQLLLRDISVFLEKNRKKPRTAQILAQNDQVLKFREYLLRQLPT
ncbi:MAG: hypothetical protein AABX31_03690 [Nanoarchaeota archaeon]